MRRLAPVLLALVLVGCGLDSPFELDLEGLTGVEAGAGDPGEDASDGEGGEQGEGGTGEEGQGAGEGGEQGEGEEGEGTGEDADGPNGGQDPQQPADAGLPDDVAEALEVLRALEQPDPDHDALLTSRAREQLADDGRLAALSEAAHLDVQTGTWVRHNHLATVSVDLVAEDGSVQATYLAWLLYRPIDDHWQLSGLDLVTEG